MATVYATDTSRCMLCDGRVRTTQHVCQYVVDARAVIGYVLCKSCGKPARNGLPPDQLRKLDAKLEGEAAAHGLTTTH